METTTSGKWQVRFVVACSMIALACAGWANALPAQESQSRRFSVDLGTGFFTGKGAGVRAERNGFTGTLQVAREVLTRRSTSVLVAFNVSPFAIIDLGDSCTVLIPPNGEPSGGCLPNFPSGAATGVLLGVEQRWGGKVALRLLAGPALFNATHSSGRAGVQTRADLAVPANKHAAFVVWGQNGFMTLKGQPRARVPMFGAGIRLQ